MSTKIQQKFSSDLIFNLCRLRCADLATAVVDHCIPAQGKWDDMHLVLFQRRGRRNKFIRQKMDIRDGYCVRLYPYCTPVDNSRTVHGALCIELGMMAVSLL